MASPYWKYPGVLSGRILPVHGSGQGAISDQIHGGVYGFIVDDYYYTYTYDYAAEHVFCLGEDGNYPEYRLYHEDSVTVLQTTIDLSACNLVYFSWLLRTSEDMPSPRLLLSVGTCNFLDGGLIQFTDPALPTDGCQGIVLPATAADLFTRDDSDRLLKVSNTGGAYDGTHRITTVPWSQADVQASPGAGQRENGQVAILETDPFPAGTPTTATVEMLGARWSARAYVDSTLRVELTERPGRSWQRNYLALHVSKLTGTHSIKFALDLEATVEP